MRRLQFASPLPAPRRVCPDVGRVRPLFRETCSDTMAALGPLKPASTKIHPLAPTQLLFPVFSSHSPLATSHCSRPATHSPLPLNSFISPSYNDSLVTPLFPLDTQIGGWGAPTLRAPARTRKFLTLFKNFQANSFRSRVFKFLTRGRGEYPTCQQRAGRNVPSVSSAALSGLGSEQEERHDTTTKPIVSAFLATGHSPLPLPNPTLVTDPRPGT